MHPIEFGFSTSNCVKVLGIPAVIMQVKLAQYALMSPVAGINSGAEAEAVPEQKRGELQQQRLYITHISRVLELRQKLCHRGCRVLCLSLSVCLCPCLSPTYLFHRHGCRTARATKPLNPCILQPHACTVIHPNDRQSLKRAYRNMSMYCSG